MTKKTILLALVLCACGDRVSLGEHGSSKEQLAATPPSQTPDETPDAGAEQADSGAIQVLPTDIEYFEVDESMAAVPRKIRVELTCRVTDHTGLDSVADPARCQELFDVSVDTSTDYGCGPSCMPDSCVGTVRMHLKDGTDLVRDLGADRCSVAVPSVATHKAVYAAWYSAGGG